MLARKATLLVASFATLVLLCSFAHAEEKKEDRPAPIQRLSDFDKNRNKGAASSGDENLSPEELHKKQLANIKAMQEKAEKAAEAKSKKKDKKKEPKEKDPTAPRAIPRGNAALVEVEPPDKGKNKGGSIDIIKSTPSKPSQIIELSGPRQSKNKQTGDTITVGGDAAAGTALEQGDINALNIKEPPQKRGFFDRLFGKDKKPAPVLQAAGKGEEFKLVTEQKKKGAAMDASRFVPAPTDRRETLSKKVQEMMALKRLEGELKDREKEAPVEPQGEKAAEVVDLSGNATTPTPATGNLAEIASKTEPKAAETEPPPITEEETRAAAEAQYRNGLGSRDVVAREASYQRAAIERRDDAIPFMLQELREDNLLAAFAVQCLGAIGKLTPEVESGLIRELASHRPEVRQACADTLGRLRSRKAVPVIMENLKAEKSYPVRGAYMDALGAIGDRSAIPLLKAKLESDEIETLKSHAALALARMGDPSGRAHLVRNIDSPMPALQVLGMIGLAQINEPFMAGYLNKAMESPYEEVWTNAVYLFPILGPSQALPILRSRFDSQNEVMRRRAALAMGFLGSDEALAYIDRAVRGGTLHERVMGCELLGNLQRRDRIPLLIEKLQDPQTNVRQTAAVALTRLNATEAIPALIEGTRGLRGSGELPPGLRGAGPDVMERLIMLSCVRILRGEKDDLVITTLPNRDNSWPEVDRVMSEQQKELVKLFKFVAAIGEEGRALGVVLKSPDGNEVMYREGETVASGFKVRDIGLPSTGKDKTKVPAYVILMRGDERITLTAGRAAEVDSVKEKRR
ncbi:MAG TPA: HEAT repeat domain-containing protein [Planctomycetota bacterium]|nr:HEAT repeat domain-containing protein [Planctomycetota bacterium]